MSRIFLSYARPDAARAKSLAKALERAGHEIWWDRHIEGGTRFAEEIANALEKAEVIVVLWSASSIKSAWVLDEAAEGRDSNRLVPVLLDDCQPPLGFRQYQSIDLSRWTPRRALPDTLLSACLERGSTGGEARETQAQGRTRKVRRHALAAIALTMLLAAIVLGIWSLTSPSEPETPTLAVLPFVDLSPGGDKQYFAEGIAESLLGSLSRETGIRVVGRNSTAQFGNGDRDPSTIGEVLGVTHFLEGSTRIGGDQIRMSVRLIDASDGTQMWAEDYRRETRNVFAVQDEIGAAVAQRLVGTLAAKGTGGPVTAAAAYDLYLAARAKMRSREEPDLRRALTLARQVVAADPGYAPGHALYAELIWLLSDDENSYGAIPVARARKIAIASARKAIALDPRSPEGYAALGLALPARQSLEPLRWAISLDPSRAEIRVWLALHLEMLGRNEEAFEQFSKAAEVEPLWAMPINRYSYTLAASGRIADAQRVIDDYADRGGDPAQAARFRSTAARLAGDLSTAVEQALVALKTNPSTPYVREYLESHAAVLDLPSLVDWQPQSNRRFAWLRAKGDRARLLAEARAAGRSLWSRPDSTIAVLALAEARDWQTLEMLHDTRPDSSAPFCNAAQDDLIVLALALAKRGRDDEARALMGCASKWLEQQSKGPYRSAIMEQSRLAFEKAQLLALSGRTDLAFERLESAVRSGWRGSGFSSDLTHFPAFDSLRSDARFGKLQRRIDQAMDKERTELFKIVRKT